MKKYTVGIDYGTLSGRAVLMDVESGEIVATSVSEYAHGVIDETMPSGEKLPQNYALQHALDYVDVLRTAIPAVIKMAKIEPSQVVGVGIDFTGCTMMPVDEDMRPLMFDEKYKNEPHAYVKLWKHNSPQKESDAINRLAIERGEEWINIYGRKTSPEWMFAKIFQILHDAPEVYENTDKFLNSADWVTFLLTGEITNSAPFAGYKELWNEETGFPSPSFLEELDPRLKDLVGTKLCDNVISINEIAGYITREAAELTGLCEGTPVAVPVLDAHASMPALALYEEGVLMLILGTSAVQLVHSKEKRAVTGICGYMKDGIMPDLYTYEASQACCGDHLDWFVKNCVPASYTEDAREKGMNIHKYLRERAMKLKVGESGLLALDWQNGNRSILTDSSLTGAIFGMTLRTKPEEIYRALIEATVFGTRKILDNFADNGVRIDRIVASGGIAEKDEMFMQICADVLGVEVLASDVKMSAAKGSAIFATVAAGAYENVTEASRVLGVKSGKLYTPVAENVAAYDKLYREYCILHDYFGRGGNNVLKTLRDIH